MLFRSLAASEDEVTRASHRADAALARAQVAEAQTRGAESRRGEAEGKERDLETRIRELSSAKALLEGNMQSQGTELRGMTKQCLAMQSEVATLRAALAAKTELVAALRGERDRAEATAAAAGRRAETGAGRAGALQSEVVRLHRALAALKDVAVRLGSDKDGGFTAEGDGGSSDEASSARASLLNSIGSAAFEGSGFVDEQGSFRWPGQF